MPPNDFLDDLIDSAHEPKPKPKPKPKPAHGRNPRHPPKASLFHLLEDSPSGLNNAWATALGTMLDQLASLDEPHKTGPLMLSILERVMLARAAGILTALGTTGQRLEYLMSLAVGQGDVALAVKVVRMIEELRLVSNPDAPIPKYLSESLTRIESVQRSAGPPFPGHAAELGSLLVKARAMIEKAEAEAEDA